MAQIEVQSKKGTIAKSALAKLGGGIINDKINPVINDDSTLVGTCKKAAIQTRQHLLLFQLGLHHCRGGCGKDHRQGLGTNHRRRGIPAVKDEFRRLWRHRYAGENRPAMAAHSRRRAGGRKWPRHG